MRKIYLLGSLLVAFTGTQAQITLTQADFAQPGDTLYYAYDTVNVSSSLQASAGADKTWDFSGAARHETGPTWFLNPANSPIPAPAEITHVMIEKEISDVSFLNVTATELTTRQPNPVAFLGGSPFLSVKSLTFPLQYQTLTQDSTTDRVVVDANMVGLGTLFDSVRISFKINLNSLCDGWGTLITPKGSYNCLRLKNTVNVTFKFEGKNNLIGTWLNIPISSVPFPVPEKQKDINYMWIGTNSKYVLAQSVMVTDTEDQQDEFFYQAEEPVNSGLLNMARNTFSLTSYPNPAQTEVSLQFTSTRAEQLQVTFYDVQGKAVKSSAYTSTAGNNTFALQVDELPAGLYSVQLSGAETNGMTKVLITK